MREDAQGNHGSYVSEESILSHITGVMQKVGISLVRSLVPGSGKCESRVYAKEKTDRAGNVTTNTVTEYLFSGEMNFRWVNNENPDDCAVSHWPIAGNAADMSQAIGKALTYGNRYYLLKFFDIATAEDDPDALLRNIAAGAADEAALKEMVAQIDAAFKRIPAEDKEKRSAVAVVITPIIQKDTGKKSANYMTLKTLEAAAEVFAAVQKILGEAGG
ncbi:MAG: ERF family protein [Oscillospiraceae bacterium]|nr:ERF family protein [Oscillospiraceae bacterium]